MRKYKYVVLLFLMSLIASCDEEITNNDSVNTDESIHITEVRDNNGIIQYEKITASGHEYIRFGSGNGQWGGHSGTCPNPIHTHTIHDTIYMDAMENHSQIK